MLVIELSTARITAARAVIIRSAVVAGGLAIGLGVLAAWLIARSIARRLRVISVAATRVAGGDLSDIDVRDTSTDEIGTLTTAFGTMVQQIRELVASRDEAARQEQARLETLVAEPTRELASRNRALAFVLDNVDQGLFIVDRTGVLSKERSRAVERLLGPVPADGLITSYVLQFDREQAAWFDVCWAALRDGLLPPELALSQIPRRFLVQGRHLDLSYQVVEDDDGTPRILVVVSDISARVARERAERDQQEIAGLATRLFADRCGFLEFHAEMTDLIGAMASRQTDVSALERDAHTLKGTAALYGLTSIVDACHVFEDRLAEHDPDSTALAFQTIAIRWRELAEHLQPFTSARHDVVEVSEAEIESVVAQLQALPGTDSIVTVMKQWRHEPVRARLERLAGHIRALSTRLGKGPVMVRIEADASRAAPGRCNRLWGALVHVVRNAVDHGLETPQERVALGKALDAPIALRAATSSDALVIEVEDAGRGIDWTRLAESARAAGLACETQDDLVRALFASGVTTREHATTVSGRGVGLAAAHQACIDAGGTVRVDSRAGLGTRFTFVVPTALPEEIRC